MLKALHACAPVPSDIHAHYVGNRRILIVWGGGRPDRVDLLKRHRAAGGITVAWDLAYWDREGAARLGINSLHPIAAQLEKAPEGQGRRDFALRDDADPAGPILLVGLGHKSARMLGVGALDWERKRLRQLQARFPGRPIWWRPKGKDFMPLPDTVPRWGMPIDEALRGCSLVVCRHSNVAIDACIAGVPVQCVDGAALALYSQTQTPTREQRAEFLRQVGFWNWSPAEAPQAWAWLKRVAAAAPSAA